MREREKQRLIGKMNIKAKSYGNPLYLRPFKKDGAIIEELSRKTGKKKCFIAQNLLHLAIKGKTFDFSQNTRQEELLEWIVRNERQKSSKVDEVLTRLERLEEHARFSEESLKIARNNSTFIRKLTAEIFCMMTVSMSYINQVFTKIIQYLSPVEIERKNSSDFANRNILFLIEYSLAELENLGECHALDLDEEIPEMLYLYTKIEDLRSRLEEVPQKENN